MLFAVVATALPLSPAARPINIRGAAFKIRIGTSTLGFFLHFFFWKLSADQITDIIGTFCSSVVALFSVPLPTTDGDEGDLIFPLFQKVWCGVFLPYMVAKDG